MAGNCEQQVVIERRKVREFIYENLWDWYMFDIVRSNVERIALASDSVLGGFGEEFVGELAEPLL